MVIVTIIILSASSLLFTVVGLSRLFSPMNTYSKNSGIDLPKDVNLLSEVRGQAAVMLGSGIIFVLGAIFSQITTVSLAMAVFWVCIRQGHRHHKRWQTK